MDKKIEWIVPDVVIVGYGRTQAIQIKCLHCGIQFFPGKETIPVCEICEREDWKSTIKEWRFIRPINTLNVIGWEQRYAIGSNKKRVQTYRNYNRVYKRDNYVCQYCGYELTLNKILALHIDHITPYIYGGNNSENNLVVSCMECNLFAGAKCFSNFLLKKTYIQKKRKKMGLRIYKYDLCPFPELKTSFTREVNPSVNIYKPISQPSIRREDKEKPTMTEKTEDLFGHEPVKLVCQYPPCGKELTGKQEKYCSHRCGCLDWIRSRNEKNRVEREERHKEWWSDFETFNQTYPDVLEFIVDDFIRVRALGYLKYGLRAPWEPLRWHLIWKYGTSRGLNDHFTTFYRDMLLDLHPEFRTMIEVRSKKERLKAEERKENETCL